MGDDSGKRAQQGELVMDSTWATMKQPSSMSISAKPSGITSLGLGLLFFDLSTRRIALGSGGSKDAGPHYSSSAPSSRCRGLL
jgi:hypothetical protein